MSLFNAWYTKSSTFDEFEIAQNQTIDQSGNGLRDNWVTAVHLAFKSSFKDVGTAHYTLCIASGCPYLRCTLTGVSCRHLGFIGVSYAASTCFEFLLSMSHVLHMSKMPVLA